jgi:hypothetical protein
MTFAVPAHLLRVWTARPIDMIKAIFDVDVHLDGVNGSRGQQA